jgi:hypothetical protein
MRSVLGALCLSHFIAIGLVAVALGGGRPSHWFGLVGAKVTEVERACLERHRVEPTASVENIGKPQAVVSDSPAARASAVRVAERAGRPEPARGPGDRRVCAHGHRLSGGCASCM